jgi:hypothetical protein
VTKPRRPAEGFTHRHQSGKWDASAEEWQAAVDAATDGVDVATFTETTAHRPTAPAGYRRVWTRDAADVALYLKQDTFSLDGAAGVEVAGTRYRLGGKHLKPTLRALFSRLRTKATDRPLVIADIHEPSAIEGEIAAHGQKSRFPRVKAVFESFAGIHATKRRIREEHGRCAFILTEDGNLDLHKLWVRVLFRVRFPGLALSFKTLPARGDLGDRLISVSFYSRRWLTTTGSVLDKVRHPGFDHLGFTTPYRFKRKARR